MREVEVNIGCQPERRKPAPSHPFRIYGRGVIRRHPLQGGPDYTDHNSDCHPFWHIRRSNCVGEFNSAVVEVATKISTSSPMKELKIDLYHSSSGLLEFEVTVPCIVNTAKIAGGAEIVLRWENKPAYKTRIRQKRKVIDAFCVGAPQKKNTETVTGLEGHAG